MTLPVLFTLCLAVITLLAFLLLIGRAFSRSTTWGLLVMLFSPVSAVAYGVRYGREERIVLGAYLGSFIVTAALALFLFSRWGGWELVQTNMQVDQAVTDDRLRGEDVQHLEALALEFKEHSGLDLGASRVLARAEQYLEQQAAAEEAETTAATATAEPPLDLKSMTRKAKPEKERFRLTYVTIDITEAPRYVGATVKVTRRNVVEKEYRLVSASSNRLELAQRAGSGSYTFRYRNSDIEKIRVLTKQPY